MEELIIVGCGGHAKAIIDIAESSEKWKIAGIIGLEEEVGKNVCGHMVIGCDKDMGQIIEKVENLAIGIGHMPGNDQRKKAIVSAQELGFKFPAVISKSAIVSRNSTIGSGTTIGHNAVINAGATIGDFTIINTMSLVEHDAKVGKNCHISTGALINGGVEIGDGSFVGSGAMIREGLVLPKDAIVSAGKRVMGWPLS